MTEQRITINPEDLTMGDLEDFEEITGKDLFEILPSTPAEAVKFRPSAKVMKALVYLSMRAQNPEFTLEDARNVKVSQLDLGTAPNPTEAAG